MPAPEPHPLGFVHVTQVLAAMNLGPDLSRVPEHYLEPARERGSALHEAIEAHALGLEPEPEVLNGCAPYFAGYRKFVAETGHEPIVSELKVEHPLWRVVGRLDRVGWQHWPDLGVRRTLYDFKSGEALKLKPVGRQLAGYRMCWNFMRPGEPIEVMAAVQFRADGTYRLHRIDDPEAEQVFQAACLVWHAGGGVR